MLYTLPLYTNLGLIKQPTSRSLHDEHLQHRRQFPTDLVFNPQSLER